MCTRRVGRSLKFLLMRKKHWLAVRITLPSPSLLPPSLHLSPSLPPSLSLSLPPSLSLSPFLPPSLPSPLPLPPSLPPLLSLPLLSQFTLILALMGLMEKRRFKNLLQFVYDYDFEDPKTHSKLSTIFSLGAIINLSLPYAQRVLILKLPLRRPCLTSIWYRWQHYRLHWSRPSTVSWWQVCAVHVCMCACLLCLTAVPAGTHDCYSTCTGCFGFAFCPYLVPVLSLIVMNTTSLIKWA